MKLIDIKYSLNEIILTRMVDESISFNQASKKRFIIDNESIYFFYNDNLCKITKVNNSFKFGHSIEKYNYWHMDNIPNQLNYYKSNLENYLDILVN